MARAGQPPATYFSRGKIQWILDNLDGVGRLLARIVRGEAEPVSVAGRASGSWGQPRLSSYLRLRRRLARQHALSHA